MRSKFIVLFVLYCATYMAAQCSEQKSLVTASGVGEVRVVPDEVSLVISVQNFSAEAVASRSENDRRMKKVLAVIQQLGIDAKDYKTIFTDTDPRYKDYDEAKGLRGFFSSSGVSVKLRDITKLSELKVKAFGAGATSFGEVQFSTSHLTERRAEARALAVRAAKEKAAAMSEQLGQRIGKAFSITEVTDSGEQWGGYGYSTRAANAQIVAGAESGPSEAAGVISIKESVSVSFLLE
jgi:uncharacterized protein YggE